MFKAYHWLKVFKTRMKRVKQVELNISLLLNIRVERNKRVYKIRLQSNVKAKLLKNGLNFDQR